MTTTDHERTGRDRLAAAIRGRRRELGLSQRDAADRAGVSPRTLSHIETAAGPTPAGRTLARIDDALLWPHTTATRLLHNTVAPAATGTDHYTRADVELHTELAFALARAGFSGTPTTPPRLPPSATDPTGHDAIRCVVDFLDSCTTTTDENADQTDEHCDGQRTLTPSTDTAPHELRRNT